MAPKNASKPVKNPQGGILLWHGMTLLGVWRFLKSRPPMSVSRIFRILSLPFFGLYNSVLGGLESLIYGRAIRKTKVEHAPIFVLGYWRSGTTLLQTLLSRDPNFQHLGLYRAMFPWHFLLTEKLVTSLTSKFLPDARPMDNMKVSWDAPQEDDMALCIMSQISPMMIAANAHNWEPLLDSLDFSRLKPKDLQRWKDSLELLVKKMAYADPRQIMMKSPFHMYHIPLLQEMYPEAKFIFIHRNPYNVFRSTLHLRRRVIEENCLANVPFDGMGHEDSVITSQKMGFDFYMRDREEVPKGQLYEICYEELEKDPVAVLRGAYEQLGLSGFEGLEQAIQPELESLRNYKKNKFKDDPELVNRVYEQLKPMFDHYGYDKPVVEAAESETKERATAV